MTIRVQITQSSRRLSYWYWNPTTHLLLCNDESAVTGFKSSELDYFTAYLPFVSYLKPKCLSDCREIPKRFSINTNRARHCLIVLREIKHIYFILITSVLVWANRIKPTCAPCYQCEEVSKDTALTIYSSSRGVRTRSKAGLKWRSQAHAHDLRWNIAQFMHPAFRWRRRFPKPSSLVWWGRYCCRVRITGARHPWYICYVLSEDRNTTERWNEVDR